MSNFSATYCDPHALTNSEIGVIEDDGKMVEFDHSTRYIKKSFASNYLLS